MWSDTSLKLRLTVCCSDLESERCHKTYSHPTWRLVCSFILSEPPTRWFWLHVFFCTEDEGDLCEYTTWSCTVDVHRLGHMLNVLLTLLWDESVCVAWIIIFLCESKTEVESVLPVLFQKNHNDHMKPSELVAFCYLYYFIRNLQGADILMKDCND